MALVKLNTIHKNERRLLNCLSSIFHGQTARKFIQESFNYSDMLIQRRAV